MSEYMVNGKGESVHRDLIRGDVLLKDALVNALALDAAAFRDMMGEFRKASEQKIEAYFGTLMERYGLDAKKGSRRGNITLENFASTAKVQIAVADKLTFDEKIQLAKMKFDEYFEQVTQGSSEEIKLLITRAFDVDKEGNVDVKRILELRSYNIIHPLWCEAVALIEESKQVVSSKGYIRFYTRPSYDAPWQHVCLDLACV